MEMTHKLFEKILSKLPIGYYLGDTIPVVPDYESYTSFYSPRDYQIHIAYNNIENFLPLLEKANTNYDPENLIRMLMYHELSHVILTPEGMKITKILNIFEDERIETLLRDYYMGVDFKGVLTTCYDMTLDPNTMEAMNKFFYAVRLRLTTDEINQDITDLIEKYKYLEHKTRSWQGLREYQNEVVELYKKITGELPPDDNEGNGDGENNSNENNDGEENQNGNSDKDGSDDDNKNAQKQNSTQSEISDHSKQTSKASSMSIGEIKQKMKNCFGTFQRDKEEIKKSLEGIILGFAKRTNNGMAVQKYSGRLNPKLLTRDDYRIFERIATGNGNNKYGTFHLNLFQDNSGSYEYNMDKTNALIQALTELEEKYSFFTCTIFHCGNGQEKKERDERFIDCCDGTYLSADIAKQFKECQLANTYNYNIVLYDGDASPAKLPNGKNAFYTFGHSNVTMILDSYNAKYVKNIKGAHIIISNGNYCEELYENVIKAFTYAMR